MRERQRERERKRESMAGKLARGTAFLSFSYTALSSGYETHYTVRKKEQYWACFFSDPARQSKAQPYDTVAMSKSAVLQSSDHKVMHTYVS